MLSDPPASFHRNLNRPFLQPACHRQKVHKQNRWGVFSPSSPAQAIRSRGATPKIFFVDQRDIDIIGGLVRSWPVSQDPPHIPPDKKRTFLYQCPLLSRRYRQIVNMSVAEQADDQDACRRVAFHLFIEASRDAMDFKKRWRMILMAKLAGIFDRDPELLFLHGSDIH